MASANVRPHLYRFQYRKKLWGDVKKVLWKKMFLSKSVTKLEDLMVQDADFLEEIQTKVWRVFLLVIHSHLYSLAMRFLFFQTHATSYSFYICITLHCKGERMKIWQKTTPPPLRFKKTVQKTQVWELSRLCPETSKKLHVHEFCFCFPRATCLQ